MINPDVHYFAYPVHQSKEGIACYYFKLAISKVPKVGYEFQDRRTVTDLSIFAYPY